MTSRVRLLYKPTTLPLLQPAGIPLLLQAHSRTVQMQCCNARALLSVLVVLESGVMTVSAVVEGTLQVGTGAGAGCLCQMESNTATLQYVHYANDLGGLD